MEISSVPLASFKSSILRGWHHYTIFMQHSCSCDDAFSLVIARLEVLGYIAKYIPSFQSSDYSYICGLPKPENVK